MCGVLEIRIDSSRRIQRPPPEFPLGGLSEFFSCRVAVKHPSTLSKGCPAMLARSSVQSGASRSVFGSSRPFASGLIASVAALAFISGLVMFVSTARSMVDPSAQTVPSGQTVNRALKGDRLPLRPASRSDVANQPVELRVPRTSTPDSRMPDGCEAVVSSIVNSELAHIAGRCVS